MIANKACKVTVGFRSLHGGTLDGESTWCRMRALAIMTILSFAFIGFSPSRAADKRESELDAVMPMAMPRASVPVPSSVFGRIRANSSSTHDRPLRERCAEPQILISVVGVVVEHAPHCRELPAQIGLYISR